MAQYDWSSAELNDDFQQRNDLSQGSRAAISGILGSQADGTGKNRVFQVDGTEGSVVRVPGDVDIVEVNTALGTPRIEIPAGKPMVVVILGDNGVTVVVEYDGSAIVVIGGGGDDVISFVDSIVSIAETDGSKSIAGSASAAITADSTLAGAYIEGLGGDDTIETASGPDTIIGGEGDDRVASGAGDDTIYAGLGNDTIDGGSGWDTVVMEDGNYTVERVGSELVVRNTTSGANTTIGNTEYIALSDTSAAIVAADRENATAARQAQAILDRQMSSEELKDYNALVDGIGLEAASTDLQLSSGYTDATSSLSDTEFIELQYHAIFGRDADETGLAFYEDQLLSGFIDRGKLVADLSWSDEGVDSYALVFTIDLLI